MTENNVALFKAALREGLSKKIDSVVNESTDEIHPSEQHKLAMKTIIYGKAEAKRNWSPKVKRIIAILIAAALILTSCGIIFRNEIREIVEDFYVSIVLGESKDNGDVIEEVYTLTYLPEGYYLVDESIRLICVQYTFSNDNEEYIWFEQRLLGGSAFAVDSENGYSQIKEIDAYNVYYRTVNNNHVYIWKDNKYSVKIKSTTALSANNICLILDGLAK